MSSNGLVSNKIWIFWGLSTTLGGGDRSVDVHQAFNPMIRAIDFPSDMKYTIEKRTTCDSLVPNIEFDKQLEEGTVRFQCHFRDPIILATVFGYKGLPTSWTGTGDTMTFNFSNLNNRDKNIWVQLHVPDPTGSSNHLDIFLDGGEIINYKISYSQGQPIMEEFSIKFTEINVATDTDSTGAYAPDIDDGFDDGSFNQTGVAEVTAITCPAASAITTGQYFKFWLANGTGGWTAYYVWFNKDAGGGDPAPSGYTGIEVTISTGNTNAQVATALGSALDAAADGFGTPVVNSNVVTVTSQATGDVKDAVNVNVGTGFSISVSTQGVTDADGGWSNWDGDYSTKRPAMAYDCTPTFNGTALTDLTVQSFSFEVNVPKTRYRQSSSLTVAGSYLEKHDPYKAILTGILTKGNVNMAEPSKTIANKTQGTLKLLYGTTKYLQFTNSRVEQVQAGGKDAGKVYDATFNIIAGAGTAVSFVWTANEATDPSTHITHTNV